MKKIPKVVLFFTLIFILPITLVFAEDLDCPESMLQGKTDAQAQHTSGGWFLVGIPSGILGGPLGVGIVTVVGAVSGPLPKTYPDEGETNIPCYLEGYRKKARSKNAGAALGGGLLGLAVLVAGVFIIYTGFPAL